jgi:rRNA maturation endonuclease Nob1
MYKGFRNRLKEKDITNKSVNSLNHVNKCTRCFKLNPSFYSPAINNVQNCLYCGNPFYQIK